MKEEKVDITPKLKAKYRDCYYQINDNNEWIIVPAIKLWKLLKSQLRGGAPILYCDGDIPEQHIIRQIDEWYKALEK